MPTNKNASIRYQALDKCFRDRRHRYYIDDLIDKCEEALYYYNGVGGVSRRQVFEDIKFMESDTGWSIPLERKKDGKKVYYRYEDPDFSINEQPLTDEEAQQLGLQIIGRMRDYLDAKSEETGLNFTLLATPSGVDSRALSTAAFAASSVAAHFMSPMPSNQPWS